MLLIYNYLILEFIARTGAIKCKQDGTGVFCMCDAVHGRYAIIKKPTRSGLCQHDLPVL